MCILQRTSTLIIFLRAGPYTSNVYIRVQLRTIHESGILVADRPPIDHLANPLNHGEVPPTILSTPQCHLFHHDSTPLPQPPHTPLSQRRLARHLTFPAPPPNRTRPRLRQHPNMGLRRLRPNFPVRLHGRGDANLRPDSLRGLEDR